MSGFSGFNRIMSLVVVVCFLTTNVQAMPSQSLSLGTSSSGLDQFSSSILSLSIPSSLGSVVETYDASKPGTRDSGLGTRNNERQNTKGKSRGASSRFVVYIQDAHDSLEAQENIAEMVRWFVKDYGVKTVYEEGYEGPVPTDELFGRIKDPALREKISYYLMDKLRVGGAEYAHINRKTEGDSQNEEPKRVPSPGQRLVVGRC